MSEIIKRPVPLFFIDYEFQVVHHRNGIPKTLNVAGDHVIPVTEARSPREQLSGDETRTITLTNPFNDDVLHTAEGPLFWEYSQMQLEVLLDVANRLHIRAYDVAAFIAHEVFPHLGVLDSAGNPIESIYSLPANHLDIDQVDTHLDRKLPLSATPADARHRTHDIETGPKASGRYLITAPDPRFDIKLVYTENPDGADVIIRSLPAALPPAACAELAPMMHQHVPYTEEDRRSDLFYGGSPDKEEFGSEFARGVNYAVWLAKLAITDAVFAHAEGVEWVCSQRPYARGDGVVVIF